jgi:hypothetical protein
METLAVCETLGAGMGAKQKDVDGGKGKGKEKENGDDGPISNAPLRLWVGERFLGMFSISLLLYRSVLMDKRRDIQTCE